MFRYIPTGSTHQVIRPIFLLKVRNNLPQIGITASSNNGTNGNNGPPFSISIRQNSSTLAESKAAKIDGLANKIKKDPLYREVVEGEARAKLDYFKEEVSLAHQFKSSRDRESQRAFVATVDNLCRLFEDDAIRGSYTSQDLYDYAQLMNFSIFKNRTDRLSSKKNRDSDQYQHENLSGEVLMKSAVMSLSDTIVNGEFDNILNPGILLYLFFSMKQCLLHQEMLNLWENGVNNNGTSQLYLDERLLAVILPIAYEEKRFTYEEILHIYEINTRELPVVSHDLLCSMGKIAIHADDYSRGLDCLESLLHIYESGKQKTQYVLSSLAELHLNFIGSCKDIKIARHFYDKVIQHDLPYQVLLKVPFIQSLLENCYEVNEPFENIMYFWKKTISHYNAEKGTANLNSRYAILNNTFFAIFFKVFQSLNTDSYAALKDVILAYREIKNIDEVFLNTVITNYSWNDKHVLEQLIDSYSIYNVSRTPVSFRVCLKKVGELSDYSNEEILEKWNDALYNLDKEGYNYIPVADWAALRDATILSEYSSDRKPLYLCVAHAYKNYIQDERSCVRFIKYWSKRKDFFNDILRLSSDNDPFLSSCEINVPAFQNLRPNIDYQKMSLSILLH